MTTAELERHMLKPKDDAAEQKQREGVQRVIGWLEDMLPDEERDEEDGGSAPPGKETSVICNQLACKEEGCPDVEVVMTLLRAKPRPKFPPQKKFSAQNFGRDFASKVAARKSWPRRLLGVAARIF